MTTQVTLSLLLATVGALIIVIGVLYYRLAIYSAMRKDAVKKANYYEGRYIDLAMRHILLKNAARRITRNNQK